VRASATAAAGSSAALQSSSSAASAETSETPATPVRTMTPRKSTPRKRKAAGLQAGMLTVVKEMGRVDKIGQNIVTWLQDASQYIGNASNTGQSSTVLF